MQTKGRSNHGAEVRHGSGRGKVVGDELIGTYHINSYATMQFRYSF